MPIVFNVAALLVAAVAALGFAALSFLATDLVRASPVSIAAALLLVASLVGEAMQVSARLFWAPTWVWAVVGVIFGVNAEYGRTGLTLAALGGGAVMVAGLVFAQHSLRTRETVRFVEALRTMEKQLRIGASAETWRAVDAGLRADWSGTLTVEKARLLGDALAFVVHRWPEGYDPAAREELARAAEALRSPAPSSSAPVEPLAIARTVAEVEARRSAAIDLAPAAPVDPVPGA